MELPKQEPIVPSSNKVVNKGDDGYPLTKIEQQMYIIHSSLADKTMLNAYNLYRLKGEVDIVKLQQCIGVLFNRHSSMRCAYRVVDSQIRRVNLPNIQPTLNIVECNYSQLDSVASSLDKPFSLTDGYLWSFALIKTTDNGQFLFVNFHHIAGDFSSMQVVVKQLFELYNDRQLPEQRYDFTDYELDQQKTHSDCVEEQLPYWENMFHDSYKHLNIATDMSTAEELPYQDSMRSAILGGDLFDKVLKFAKSNGVTVFDVLLSGVTIMLNQYSQTDDLTIGIPYSARKRQELKDVVGMFVTNLPIRFSPSNELNLWEYIKGVKVTVNDSVSNGDCTLDEIKKSEYTSIDANAKSLFEVVVNYLHIDDEYVGDKISISQGRTIVSYLNNLLAIDINRTKDFIYIDFLYSKQVFEAFTIDSMLNRFFAIITNMVKSDVTTSIRDVIVLTDDEYAMLTTKMVEKCQPSIDTTLKRVLETSFLEHQDSLALVADGTANLTYGGLNALSNRVANELVSLGVKSEDKIIVLLPRDYRLIATIVGIIKSGAAFIPLDPTSPTGKIYNIVEDCNAKFVITTADKMNVLPFATSLNVDSVLNNDNTADVCVDDLQPNNLSYIIYTSGSTGKPKGVMIEQKSIANYCKASQDNFYVNTILANCSTMLSITTVAFDIFLEETMVALANGMTLVVANEEQTLNPLLLSQLIVDNNVDALSSTPSRIQQFLSVEEYANAMQGLKVIILGGEQFPIVLYNEIRKYSLCIVYNTYGPTETTIATNAKQIDGTAVTIGAALPNVILYIVDEDLNLLPFGAMGEMLIGGTGVARGYVGNTKLTNEKFINFNGKRVYRSGDYARWTVDREIKIYGRIDSQIKLRGLRIEPGEIEHTILQYPGITGCVVAVKDINDAQCLCAYYTSVGKINIALLKEFISKTLAAYMVPVSYNYISKLPLTTNGKLDYKALPKPTAQKRKIVKPQNATQKMIFDILAKLVGHIEFGITDDIFTIGVTSLTTINVIIELNKAFNVNLKISDILKRKTIADIEKALVSSNDEQLQTQQVYPLTRNQQDMFDDTMANAGVVFYNIPFVIKFSHQINAVRLRDAVISAVSAHSHIKTYFTKDDNNRIWQHRNDDAKVEVETYFANDSDIDTMASEFVRPFDLLKDRLYRFSIVTTQTTIYLFGDMHHTVCDGWSQQVFITDIAKAYDNIPIENETFTAFDNALLEHNIVTSPAYKQIMNKLKNVLSYKPTALPNTVQQSGSTHDRRIVYVERTKLDKFCKKHKNTATNVLFTALFLALRVYTGHRKLGLFNVYNGRNEKNISSVGLFINYLPIMAEIDDEQTLMEFCNTIYKQSLEMMALPYVSTLELLKDFCFDYSIEYNYITDDECTDFDFGGELVRAQMIETKQLHAVPVSVNVFARADSYKVCVDYDCSTFGGEYMSAFAQLISKFAQAICETPSEYCGIAIKKHSKKRKNAIK